MNGDLGFSLPYGTCTMFLSARYFIFVPASFPLLHFWIWIISGIEVWRDLSTYYWVVLTSLFNCVTLLQYDDEMCMWQSSFLKFHDAHVYKGGSKYAIFEQFLF